MLADKLSDRQSFYADKDYFKAAEAIKVNARQGDAEAQCALGTLFETGRGVPKDDQQAIFWYRKAADQGLDVAQDRLGSMYENGRGVRQDYQQAEFHLGWLYDIGKGVEQNYQQAAMWYRKAAAGNSGSAAAKYNLGLIYEFGRGVKQDPASARIWYSFAASQNLASAQFRLGWAHEIGDSGAIPNYPIAVSWYQQAANQGYVLAQPQLNLLTSNEQTPCNQNEMDYSVVRATEELPLKPGMWKVQSFVTLKRVSANGAERKICFAEKTLCVVGESHVAKGKFWPPMDNVIGNPLFGNNFSVASENEIHSYIDWQGNDPAKSVRINRQKYSNEQYEYIDHVRTSANWSAESPSSTEDQITDRMAKFVGVCTP